MMVSGVDQDGEPRIVELPDRRFCLATLFVLQTSSSVEAPHPIVAGFARAAHEHSARPVRSGG